MISHKQMRATAPPDCPIPDRLNVALVLVVFTFSLGLMWLSARVDVWYLMLAVGVAFSYLGLTNYALLHESAHSNLHSNPRMNRLLGTMCGLLFPCPFSLIRSAHQGHHIRNRTDFEMFDMYYPTDSRLVRYIQWYGILCGMFWPWVPIGAVLFAACPAILRTKMFRQARSSSYILSDITESDVRAIQLLEGRVLGIDTEALLVVQWLSNMMFAKPEQ